MGIDDAASVSAGIYHTCALRQSGQALCWGSNDDGELGDGALIDQPTPVPVIDP